MSSLSLSMILDGPMSPVTAAKTCRPPNVDRIARSGVAFDNGYVAASVCAVSRAGLLTGRMPASFGSYCNINDRGDADQDAGLPVSQPTIAERLKP